MPRRRIPVQLAPGILVLVGLLMLVAGTVRGQESGSLLVGAVTDESAQSPQRLVQPR